MAKETFRAKVTRYDSGTTVVEPYQETGSARYDYLLSTQYSQLRRTRSHYIAVFRFPRVEGILAATRNLINEAARLAILMTNEYFNHGEK